jgi:hypothetical protein
MPISEKEYEIEIQMCKELSSKNGGKCNWGICKDCGVIPLLHKLYKGELLEDLESIEEAKSIFDQNN